MLKNVEKPECWKKKKLNSGLEIEATGRCRKSCDAFRANCECTIGRHVNEIVKRPRQRKSREKCREFQTDKSLNAPSTSPLCVYTRRVHTRLMTHGRPQINIVKLEICLCREPLKIVVSALSSELNCICFSIDSWSQTKQTKSSTYTHVHKPEDYLLISCLI